MEFETEDYVMVPRDLYNLMQAALMSQLSPGFHDTIQQMAAKAESMDGEELVQFTCLQPGTKKMRLIKEIRHEFGLPLKEAKEWTEGQTPALVGNYAKLAHFANHCLTLSPGSQFALKTKDVKFTHITEGHQNEVQDQVTPAPGQKVHPAESLLAGEAQEGHLIEQAIVPPDEEPPF